MSFSLSCLPLMAVDYSKNILVKDYSKNASYD